MSDTPDWAEITVNETLSYPPAFQRNEAFKDWFNVYLCPVVAQALRNAKEELQPEPDCLIASISGAVTQEEAFQRGYRAGIEAAAKIADEWTTSKTCRDDGQACEHNRTGGSIADMIRTLAEKGQPAP